MEENIKNEVVEEDNSALKKEVKKLDDKKDHPGRTILIVVSIVLIVLMLVVGPIVMFLKIVNNNNDHHFDDRFIKDEKERMLARDFDAALIYIADKEYRDMTSYNETSSPVNSVVSIELKENSFTYVVTTHQSEVMVIDLGVNYTSYKSCMKGIVGDGTYKYNFDIDVSIGAMTNNEEIYQKFRDQLIYKDAVDGYPSNIVYASYQFSNLDKVYISATYEHRSYFSYADIEYTVSTDAFDLKEYPKEIDTSDRAVYYYYKYHLMKSSN